MPKTQNIITVHRTEKQKYKNNDVITFYASSVNIIKELVFLNSCADNHKSIRADSSQCKLYIAQD